MDNKEPEKKEPATEELSPEQMEKTTGAGIIDSIGCFLQGHGTFHVIGQKAYNGIVYEKKQCHDCGAIKYSKNGEECSESEYDSIPDDRYKVTNV